MRPATVCGYSSRLILDLSVNLLTYHAYKNKIIKIFGGNQIRPNIHIDDMVSLYYFLLVKEDLKGTFNAGFENLSIKKIASKIRKHIRCKLKILKVMIQDPTDWTPQNYYLQGLNLKKMLMLQLKR